MSVSTSEVEKIAHLARLAINPADVPDYAHSLSNIMGLVEQMQAVDTTDVTPMAHPLDAKARLRDDTITETDQRAQFQAHAPQTAAGLYLVPKVIE